MMDQQAYLKILKEKLPEKSIYCDNELIPYLSNTSGFDRKVIAAVVPTKISEIQEIIKINHDFKIPLYPISTGKNWGLGSKLPVIDGCVILDLSSFNEISDYDDDFGTVKIQPGVTQHQLAQYLLDNNSCFFSDSTGSAKETSVIGNSLERGVAYNSLRSENLVNLEVILATGEIVKTGFSHYENSPLKNIVKYGVGPSLLELFIQSNMGIVISATVKLLVRPKEFHSEVPFTIFAPDANIGRVLEKLRRLKAAGILNSVIHIANDRRTKITYGPTLYEACLTDHIEASHEDIDKMIEKQFGNGWTIVGSLSGTPGAVHDAKKLLKKEFSHGEKLMLIPKWQLAIGNRLLSLPFFKGKPNLNLNFWYKILTLGVAGLINYGKLTRLILKASEPFLGMALGQPTDAAIRSVYWPNELRCEGWQQPDTTHNGILFSCPIVPMNAEMLRKAITIIKSINNKFNVSVAATFNMQNNVSLEGVLSIDFKKNDQKSVENAHQAITAMNKLFIDAGFIPYRNTINDIHLVVDPEDAFWKTVYKIKKALDPHEIIAPGRYAPYSNK